jgi:hypothetical protein
MTNKLTILFLLTLGSLCSTAQTGQINGRLIVDKKDSKTVAKHTIILLQSKKNNKFVFLQPDLTFRIDSLNPDTVSIKLSTVFYFRDTIVSDIVIRNDMKLNLEIKYPPSCVFDHSKDNKTCPVCGKKDQTIPIIYGLLVDTGKGKKKNKKEAGIDYYVGGCVISGCDPHWYCKRDDKKF